jgi:hypothetical protein
MAAMRRAQKTVRVKANELTTRIMTSASPSRARLGLLLGFIGMTIFGGTLPATRIAVYCVR